MNLQIFQQQDCLALETVLQFVVNISHSSNFHLWKMNAQSHLALLMGMQGVIHIPRGIWSLSSSSACYLQCNLSLQKYFAI